MATANFSYKLSYSEGKECNITITNSRDKKPFLVRIEWR